MSSLQTRNFLKYQNHFDSNYPVKNNIESTPSHIKACSQCMLLQVFPCAQSALFPKVLVQHERLQAQSGTAQFQLYINPSHQR